MKPVYSQIWRMFFAPAKIGRSSVILISLSTSRLGGVKSKSDSLLFCEDFINMTDLSHLIALVIAIIIAN